MPVQTAPNKHALRFAYSTINWDTKPVMAQAFKEIRQAGWKAVELFNHPLDWMGQADYMTQAMGGLRTATSFGAIELPISAEALVIQQQRMDYAALLGAEMYGLVGGGRLRQRSPTAEEYKSLAAACEQLAKYGAGRGIGLAYHPHTGCTIETEAEIDILLNETRKMQLCLDASHIGLVGEDPVAHLRKYRARTGYVHLKDYANGHFVEMGQGNIGLDFAAILGELQAQKFPGWVVVEQSRSDFSPAASAKANAKFLRGLGYSLALPESQ